MDGMVTEWINLKNKEEKNEVQSFLESFQLALDHDVEQTLVLRKDTLIIATCSYAKNVLKCFAVREEYRGEGITTTLITLLLDKLFSQGIIHYFIFTKPSAVPVFSSLNFKLLHQNHEAALLENGLVDIRHKLGDLKKKMQLGDGEKAALVMNCNPFTLGHRYLIEEAAKVSSEVLVFVVEEERSLFPFKVRYELVSQGVSDLTHVKVIPGGEYIISQATFPSYFLREEGERLRAYVELDASIFGKYFCKHFNITKRYVGEEPYCKVTAAYNEALKQVLPSYGVEVHEVKRKAFDEQAISASQVRDFIREGKMQELTHLLPEVTLRFLRTNLGREIVEKIKSTHSPH